MWKKDDEKKVADNYDKINLDMFRYAMTTLCDLI